MTADMNAIRLNHQKITVQTERLKVAYAVVSKFDNLSTAEKIFSK